MNWYCVHTRPGKEAQTAAYLHEHFQLEIYAPKIKQRKIIRRVRREVVSALFPRYIFCRFNAAHNFRMVQYAPDVIGVVSFGNQPAIVNDGLITALKEWAGAEIDLTGPEHDLQPGETVQVVDGPMQGLRAVVLYCPSGRERVTVLLSLLRMQVPMILDREYVVKTTQSADAASQ